MSKTKTTVLLLSLILLGFSNLSFAEEDRGKTNADLVSEARTLSNALVYCAAEKKWTIPAAQRDAVNSGTNANEINGAVNALLPQMPANVRRCYNDQKRAGQSDDNRRDAVPKACSERMTAWQEAKKELTNACRDAGMSTDPIACMTQSGNCAECQGFESEQRRFAMTQARSARLSPDDDDYKTADDIRANFDQVAEGNYDYSSELCGDFKEGAMSIYNNAISSGSVFNPNASLTSMTSSYNGSIVNNRRQRFGSCPSLAGEGLDKFRDEVRDQKDIRDDLLDRLNRLREERDEIQAEIAQKDADLKEELERIEQEEKDSIKDVDQRIADLGDAALDAATQHQDAIAAADDNILQLNLEINEAAIARDNQVNEVRNNCHQDALRRVSERRERELERIRTKSFSVKSARRLFSRVGVSSRKRNEIRTNFEFRNCIKDRATRNRIKAINATHAAAKARLEAQIDQLNRAKARASQALKRAEASISDAGKRLQEERAEIPGQSLKLKQQAVERTAQEVAQLQLRLNGNVPQGSPTALMSQAAGMYKSAMNAYNDRFNPGGTMGLVGQDSGINGQIAYLERQLQQEDSYYRDKQSFLAYREDMLGNTGGGSREIGSTAKVGGEISNVEGAVRRAYSECDCCAYFQDGKATDYAEQELTKAEIRKLSSSCNDIARDLSSLSDEGVAFCGGEGENRTFSAPRSKTRTRN